MGPQLDVFTPTRLDDFYLRYVRLNEVSKARSESYGILTPSYLLEVLEDLLSEGFGFGIGGH